MLYMTILAQRECGRNTAILACKRSIFYWNQISINHRLFLISVKYFNFIPWTKSLNNKTK